jgi:cytochrome c oxidase assembly protein subunit 15
MGLAAWFLAFEPRRFMKVLGVVALLAVIVQGILGGTRVTQVSTFLAAVHGCTAQAFFGLMVALCVLTGRDWQTPGPPATDAARIRVLGLVMLVLVYGQIVLGAWMRHYGTILALALHAAFALVVFLQAILICVRVWRNRQVVPWLVPSALCLALAVTLQVVLGLASFVLLLPLDGMPHAVGFYQAVIRTGHQTNGALLLAASVVFALCALHHLRTAACEAVSPRLATAFGDGPLHSDLEVVA